MVEFNHFLIKQFRRPGICKIINVGSEFVTVEYSRNVKQDYKNLDFKELGYESRIISKPTPRLPSGGHVEVDSNGVQKVDTKLIIKHNPTFADFVGSFKKLIISKAEEYTVQELLLKRSLQQFINEEYYRVFNKANIIFKTIESAVLEEELNHLISGKKLELYTKEILLLKECEKINKEWKK